MASVKELVAIGILFLSVSSGTAFGASGEGFARISYAYSVKHIDAALERLEAFTKTLKK